MLGATENQKTPRRRIRRGVLLGDSWRKMVLTSQACSSVLLTIHWLLFVSLPCYCPLDVLLFISVAFKV